MNDRFERAPIGILETTDSGTVTAINAVATDLLAVDPEAEVGQPIEAVFPRSVEDTVLRVFDGDGNGTRATQSLEKRTVEEYYPDLDRWLSVTLVPGEETVTIYLTDTTDRRRDDRKRQALRGDLERLTISTDLISEILTELVEASTREEIAETICERLGETDIYDFAWLGERKVGSDDIVVRAAAGSTGRTLECIEASLQGDVTGPEERAVETGTPQVIEALGANESVPEAVRRAAFADGLQSLLAIPLTYGSSVYGVVGVYASTQNAFSEREQASFATVGEMAGFAVNATRQRTLLLSDTVVELTLEITDPAAPLLAIARDLETDVSINGLVPQRDGTVLCYLVVDEESPHRVVESTTDLADVTDARVISEYEEGGTIEVGLDGETPLGRLTARGVNVRSATFERGSGRIVVELPPEEDLRRVAEAVTRPFDAEVVAKRDRERDITTAKEFREGLRERLTERQETALRTAFFANYFESPRGSSAEDVASALDITGPTLLYHLRAGQRKLLEEFFDADTRR